MPGRKSSQVEKGGTADESGPPTDVLEVWFAGCHSGKWYWFYHLALSISLIHISPDVGGGETLSDDPRTLGNISLRWMLREIVHSQCGIQFDDGALTSAGIPLSMLGLESNASRSPTSSEPGRLSAEVGPGSSTKSATGAQVSQLSVYPTDTEAAKDDALDAVQPLHDELKSAPLWWVLEVIPFFVSWQDEKGVWHRAFRSVFVFPFGARLGLNCAQMEPWSRENHRRC